MKSPKFYRADTAQKSTDFSKATISRKSPGYGSSFMQASKSTTQMKQETGVQLKVNPMQMAMEEDELQMKVNPAQMAMEEDELQMKKAPLQMAMEEDELMMKADPAQKKDSQPSVQAPSGGGSKMPKGVQASMENTFGTDFSNVNIHQGEHASQVGALAYTQGNNIHFAPGQYNPQSQQGQELLGHELTHVVQQRQGQVKPTTQAKGLPVNDDPSLEAEADQMGKRAVNLQRKEDSGSQFA